MRLDLKMRLFVWFIMVSLIPMLAIGGLSYFMARDKIEQLNEETLININKGIYNMVDTQQKVLNRWLESAAVSFKEKLDSIGKSRFDQNEIVTISGYKLPTWYIGKQKITNDFTLVDYLIGKEKLPATIFQFQDNKFIRVSTNVRQADGSRITGTVIDSGPVYERLINGQEYLGRANVEGIMHATIYVPIKDSNENLVGAFVLGRKEQEYEIINAIRNIVVGETGYAFIMDPQGNAIIHPTRQGGSLLDQPSAHEMIQKKNGTITYEFNGRTKIAHYMYYEPWEWYIVTGSYASEIFNTTSKISKYLVSAILIVVVLSSLIALALSTSFSKPINELSMVMRKAQSGDLSTRMSHTYEDEFGVLSSALNTMLNNISLLIGRIHLGSEKMKEASQRLVDDITDSKESLKGIENVVKTLRQESDINQPEFIPQFSTTGHEYFQQTIYQLELLLDKSLANTQDKDLEEAKSVLERVKNSYRRAYITSVDAKNNEGTGTLSYNYINKINNLEVEIEKLKLLLRNISSSTTTLEEITGSLDRQINVFKLGNNE